MVVFVKTVMAILEIVRNIVIGAIAVAIGVGIVFLLATCFHVVMFGMVMLFMLFLLFVLGQIIWEGFQPPQ